LTDSANRVANAASALVKVVIDSPKVYAGADTLVPVGGVIRLHGQVSDGLGRIVRTEWRIGSAFRVASPDTQFAASTPGTFDFVLRAVDDDGLVAVDSVRVTVTASTSASLTELSLIGIAFDTAFLSNRYIYSASVGNSVASVKVKASVAANSRATLKVKRTPLASGGTTTAIPLNVGINLIDVEVTAQDTTIRQNYLISVHRAANNNATLQSLSTSLGPVTPAFKDTIYAYTLQAPFRTGAVTITAAPAAITTQLTLNGNAFVPNQASDSIDLTEALTQIRIETVAEAGNALAYTLTVQRDTASDEVVSDFENRSPMNSLGGMWNFFDDSPNGGNSKVLSSDTANPTPVIDASSFAAGYASSEALALGFRFGTVKPVTCGGTCTFPNYVGLSTAFMPFADSSADLTGATAITFFAKADTAMILRFAVKTANVKDFGFYQALITVTEEWKPFTVYLRPGSDPEELAQPNWANVAPFVLSKVTGLDIQISAEENTTLSQGSVLFDDVTIVGWRRP
jgi:Cadherin-like beta sandwich domain